MFKHYNSKLNIVFLLKVSSLGHIHIIGTAVQTFFQLDVSTAWETESQAENSFADCTFLHSAVEVKVDLMLISTQYRNKNPVTWRLNLLWTAVTGFGAVSDFGFGPKVEEVALFGFGVLG